jgi:hypothetical protein
VALLLFCDELMVCVGSANLSVPAELVGGVVVLVVFVLVELVVGVVEVVGAISVEVVGVVGVVEVVGLKESIVVAGKVVLRKVRVLDVPRSVGEVDAALVANPNGGGGLIVRIRARVSRRSNSLTWVTGIAAANLVAERVAQLRPDVMARERMAYTEHSGIQHLCTVLHMRVLAGFVRGS